MKSFCACCCTVFETAGAMGSHQGLKRAFRAPAAAPPRLRYFGHFKSLRIFTLWWSTQNTCKRITRIPTHLCGLPRISPSTIFACSGSLMGVKGFRRLPVGRWPRSLHYSYVVCIFSWWWSTQNTCIRIPTHYDRLASLTACVCSLYDETHIARHCSQMTCCSYSKSNHERYIKH